LFRHTGRRCEPPFTRQSSTKEIEMFTIHHSRTTIFAFATVLTLALSAPSAVIAQDQVIADEQVLAAEEQAPVLAPAVPSWDETSGYGAVEASRATIGHDAVRGFGGTGHEASAAMGRSWDDLSGYGSVEASRADMSAMLSGDVISGREQALAFAAAAATFWDATSGYGSVERTRAAVSALLTPVAAPSTCADSIPAALASSQRAESAHLATIPLPGEDTADGALAVC
jgi:hypothetical protein